MSFTADYSDDEPSTSEIESMKGPVVLEFGNSWCGFCRRAEPFVKEALSARDEVRHVRVADGSGRRLGRSYRVKLWPTLIFLDDGTEVSRLVRPDNSAAIKGALDQIHAS
jgi:thioredoxin 1